MSILVKRKIKTKSFTAFTTFCLFDMSKEQDIEKEYIKTVKDFFKETNNIELTNNEINSKENEDADNTKIN